MSPIRRKIDARAMRTRAHLKSALLSLLAAKDFASIKIKDITDKAEVSRVTFYDHYASKEDLMLELCDDTLEAYGDIMDNLSGVSLTQWPPAGLIKTVKLSVSHVKKHAEFYRVMLLSDSFPEFAGKLHEHMRRSLRRSIPAMGDMKPDVDFDLFLDWIVGGAIGMYKRWLQDGMRQSEDDISRLLLKISVATRQMFVQRAN